MALVAIIVGTFVFLLTGALIGEASHDAGAGIMPGLILGALAAIPIFKAACEERAKFLHPQPREYRVPAKIAFAKIRDILAEISYNYGDKWHVVTADTQTGRITANLRFTDEFTRFEGDARGQIHTRKERLQRFLAVDIQVQSTERGTTTILMDFRPTVEGANYAACDSIITSLSMAIQAAVDRSIIIN
ncbi:MAG: hypothetical protein EKK48_24490 [Candidatus Melainabacteria bacterium]|nr:MAG: hypothetical protein EKK48_24490 [Candidatus Melainabacteria bacterium]